MIFSVPPADSVSFGSARRLVRWRILLTRSWRLRSLARSCRAMSSTAATSTRSYQTSSGAIVPSSAIRSRYARTARPATVAAC